MTSGTDERREEGDGGPIQARPRQVVLALALFGGSALTMLAIVALLILRLRQ
jgi:hypothetical protein